MSIDLEFLNISDYPSPKLVVKDSKNPNVSQSLKINLMAHDEVYIA